MDRATQTALIVGIFCIAGCGASHVEELKAVAMQRQNSEAALRQAKSLNEAAQLALEQANRSREAAEQYSVAANHSEQHAAKALDAARLESASAHTLRTQAQALFSQAEKDHKENAAARLELERRLSEARQILAEADKAKTIVDEVNRTAAKARRDREIAEEAQQDAAQTRAAIAAERRAAAKEQLAANAAIEGARLEKAAAATALDAAQLAKHDVAKHRKLLDQERSNLAFAREEVDRRNSVAIALSESLVAHKAAAEQAQLEAAREQVNLSERIAVLEAAKEAAQVCKSEARQLHTAALAERRAAERANATADVAHQEVACEQDYLHTILTQLRGMRAQPGSGAASTTDSEAAATESQARSVDGSTSTR